MKRKLLFSAVIVVVNITYCRMNENPSIYKSKSMVLHELNNRDFVFATLLDSNSVNKFMNSNNIKSYIPKIELSGEVLINDRSSIILKLKDEVVMFENEEEFLKVIAEGYYSQTVSHSIMFGKDIAKDNFVENRYILIKELLDELGINGSIKYNKALLHQVESIVAKNDKPYLFYRKYFSNFVALLGEVFIAKNNRLKWKLEIDRDGVTWNPFLILENRPIALFSDLNEKVFEEYNYESPLSEILDSYI